MLLWLETVCVLVNLAPQLCIYFNATLQYCIQFFVGLYKRGLRTNTWPNLRVSYRTQSCEVRVCFCTSVGCAEPPVMNDVQLTGLHIQYQTHTHTHTQCPRHRGDYLTLNVGMLLQQTHSHVSRRVEAGWRVIDLLVFNAVCKRRLISAHLQTNLLLKTLVPQLLLLALGICHLTVSDTPLSF